MARCASVAAERFAAEHWGRRPLLSPGAGPYTDLLDLDAVDEILSRRGLRTPFLRIARNGAVVPPTRYTRSGGAGAEIPDQVDADRVLALFADGATVVLQGLHRVWPPVTELAGRLAADLGHPVQVNAYITPPQSQGFSAHYDVHDVFVLQVAGHKRWLVHEPVHPLPLRDQGWEQHREAVAARAAEEPHIDAVLAPGDALYLPRGWLHSAQALGGVTAHLTVGIHPVTRYALLQALLAAAADEPELRTALPLGLDPNNSEQVGPHLAAAVDVLTRRLAAAGPDEVAPAIADVVRRGTRPAPLSPVAQATAAAGLTDADVVRWRPLLPVDLSPIDDGASVRVRLSDRVLDLPAATAAALEVLAGGELVRVADLPLPTEDRSVLVRRLLLEGVVVPAPAADR